MSEIDALLNEDRSFAPTAEWRRDAVIADPDVYERAQADLEGFWAGFAGELEWMRPWDKVLEWQSPHAKWFVGGKINVSANCLDRHVRTARRNKAAFIWEGEPGDRRTLTYWDLYRQVCAFANVLKTLGVKRGDRVALYLPLIPELAISMLACARIGAIHSVVFGGFSSESLRDRINDSRVRPPRDGRRRLSPRTNRAAQADGRRGAPRHAVDQERRRRATAGGRADPGRHQGRPRSLVSPLMQHASPVCEPEAMDAEDMLYILYTSGTTGKPKGIVHTTGGYLVGTYATTKWVFDLKENDVYWCTADIGWVTGHSYVVYGPLANGATVVMYEGAPDWPQKDRFWDLIERHGVTIFYTAPTAIRAFMRWGTDWPEKHDLSTLRLLGSVGEPINPEAWMWYHRHIGRERCPIVDTWWQTETGMIMITPLPGLTTTKPGSATRPFPGVAAEIRDAQGKRVETGGGLLTLTRPWPAMLRGIYGDPDRFVQQVPGAAGPTAPTSPATAPGATTTGTSGCSGRVDDVLNVAGHRLGTMEVESALVDHPEGRRGRGRRPSARDQGAGHSRVRDGQRRREGLLRARRRAQGARREKDRRDRAAGSDSVCRRPAQDAVRQDHAPAVA